jgi:hypothetical protein
MPSHLDLPPPGHVKPWRPTSPRSASSPRLEGHAGSSTLPSSGATVRAPAPSPQTQQLQAQRQPQPDLNALRQQEGHNEQQGRERHDAAYGRADRIEAHLAWEHRRHAAFVAWTGALFWPSVDTDLFYYPFWPDAYDDAYWPDAYDDLFDSVYWATGNPDSDAPYAAPTAASLGLKESPHSGRRGGEEAVMCGSDNGIAMWPFARMESVLKLTAEQREMLDILKAVATQTAGYLKASCPREAALTPTGRLQAMISRLQPALNASHAIHAPLMTFYGSLDDEQKARFNAFGPDVGPKAETAGAANAMCLREKPRSAGVPTERIADAVRPSNIQQVKLNALAVANGRAIAILQTACPDRVSQTPVGRLEAIEARFDAMIQAAKEIQPALKDFYGSLDDEQKALFNTLGQQPLREMSESGIAP